MLKITVLFKKLVPKAFTTGNNEIVKGSSIRINKTFVNLFKSKKSKNNKSENSLHISNI